MVNKSKQCSKEDVIKLIMDKVKQDNATCEKYPEFSSKNLPSIMPAQKRVIAIGDIHGDLEVAIECLELAKVIKEKKNITKLDPQKAMDNYEWIGKKTIVVQVGDMLDDCRPKNKDNCIESEEEGMDTNVLNFFNDAHIEAIKKGGAVYTLLGNHELMNVQGNLNYVSASSLKGFADYFYKFYDRDECPNFSDIEIGKIVREYLFQPGNDYAVKMACTCLSSVIIGNYLFVHAGIIPEFVEKNNIKSRADIERINESVKKWLLGVVESKNKEVSSIITNDSYSMFWDRILGAILPNRKSDNPACTTFLDPVLDILHLDGMVIGHTPQFAGNKAGINATCGDKLWRIDTGASHAFNKFDDEYKESGAKLGTRKPQIIEIIDNEKVNIIK